MVEYRQELPIEYRQTEPTWDGFVWRCATENTYQRWWLIGTPFGKRNPGKGIRLCGSDPAAPTLPFVFGNYKQAPWDAAMYLRSFGLPLSDAKKLGWCKAGVTLREDRPWAIEDFPGIEEKIALADKLFRAAPFRNRELYEFTRDKWVTIWKGNVPLQWSA